MAEREGGTAVEEAENMAEMDQLFREQLVKNKYADKMLLDGLGSWIKSDYFKEMTFESILFSYCKVKREALGIPDDEMLTIDFVSLVYTIVMEFIMRLETSSKKMQKNLESKIDKNNYDDVLKTAAARVEKIKELKDSVKYFLKYGKRKLWVIGKKLVNRASGMWKSLHSDENRDYLRHVAHSGNKAQYFASALRDVSMYDSTTAAAAPGGGAISSMNDVMGDLKGMTASPDDVDVMIRYSREKIDKRTQMPKNTSDMRKYLEKKDAKSRNNNGSSRTSAVLLGAEGGDEEKKQEEEDATKEEVAEEQEEAAVRPIMKTFMELLYTGVVCKDECLGIHLHARNNAKKSELTKLILPLLFKHCVVNAEISEKEAVENLKTEMFGNTVLMDLIGCNFYIPFKKDDKHNISADGYCFYRAMFMLYTRSTRYVIACCVVRCIL